MYAEEWPDPPMASGNWVPDLVALVGGQSLLQSGERSRAVSREEVQAFDPDLIVLNYCGMAAVPARTQIARVARRPGWETLRATRAGRIVALDDALLNRPGPRLAEGVRQLLRARARAETVVQARSFGAPAPPDDSAGSTYAVTR